jgi:hypothetical protein
MKQRSPRPLPPLPKTRLTVSSLLFSGLLAAPGLLAACDGGDGGGPAAQVFQRQLGTAQDDALNAVSVGNNVVYAAGIIGGKLPDYVGLTQPPDAYLVKLDANGQVAWQRQYGSDAYDEWRSVAVDGAGNAYVVGYTAGSFAGQSKIGGNTDAVIARIKPDGSLDWLQQLGTTGDDYLLAVAVDASGNSYAAGSTSGTFAGQTLGGASDCFVVKYRPDGTQEWLLQFGSPKEDSATGIALDGSGAVYASAWANAAAAAAGQQPAGGRDAVLYKLMPGVGMVWARQFGSTADDEASAVSIGGSSIYIGGRTLGTLPGQSSSGKLDGFVARYDADGTQRWLRQIGTAGNEEMLAVAAATDGNSVYAGGYTSLYFPSTKFLGQKDAFYLKVRGDGTQEWVSQFGTASDDSVLGLWSSGTAVLHVAGSTGGGLPGSVPLGGLDGFVTRYSAP